MACRLGETWARRCRAVGGRSAALARDRPVARPLPARRHVVVDLLHEVVLRALPGARPWPTGVPLPAFLAGIMRSLCDEQWRRHRRHNHLPVPWDSGAADDPERACAAVETLAAIQRLFASDETALKVITGLTGGMAAEDIRRHYHLNAVEYDTTRPRIRRTMLRHGLIWSWP